MKVTGEIISISEIELLKNGAKKLHFEIDTKEEYKNILSFNLFKTAEYVSHVENFSTYNQVGDNVEVEFNIKCNEWQGKYYTSLDCWKVEKVDKTTHEEILSDLKQAEADRIQEQKDSGLPF